MIYAASSDYFADAAFSPLSEVLRTKNAAKLKEAIRAAASKDRFTLANWLQQSVQCGDRVRGHIFNEALTMQGIPPVFRYPNFSLAAESINLKNDLYMADLSWLRHCYASQVGKIRYQRYRALFTPELNKFFEAADYVFYQGSRPAWRIVASLALDNEVQHECVWLRGKSVSQKHYWIALHGADVKAALQASLAKVVRSSTFTDEDAVRSMERRYAFWVCSQMVGDSPSKIAKQYQQMTGQETDRRIVSSQLKKIKEVA
jgi:hypothetical protein